MWIRATNSYYAVHLFYGRWADRKVEKMGNRKCLVDREDSDRPCDCGCGQFAKVDSHFHSRECSQRFSNARRALLFKNARPKKSRVQQLPWPERRAAIILKYGVGNAKRSV